MIGATGTKSNNLENVPDAMFTSWYTAPLSGDLSVTGDVSSLVGAGPARAEVPDDYCARTRPAGMVTLGALEHSLGACATVTPPGGGDAGVRGDDLPSTDGSGGCCDTGAAGGARASGLLVALLALLVRPKRRR